MCMGTLCQLDAGGRRVLPCKCGACVECRAQAFGGPVQVRKNSKNCMLEADL